MSDILLGIIIIVFALIVGILSIAFILTMMKSHRLRIKDPTNKSGYIKDYMVMEHRDKDSGELFWRSVWFQPPYKCEMPPRDAISIGKKGKKYASAYRLSEGEHLWVRDTGLESQISKDPTKKYIIDSEEIFSRTDRNTLAQQIVKAKANNPNNNKWTADKVAVMGIIFMFMIGIVIVAIFLPDIMKEGKGYLTELNEGQKLLNEGINRLTMCNTGNNPQTPPTQEGDAIIQEGEKPPKDNG